MIERKYRKGRMSTVILVGAMIVLWGMALTDQASAQTQPKATEIETKNPASRKQVTNKQAEVSLYGKVVVAGLGGFLGWILTKSVGLVILRRRLISYLVVVINSHLRQYHEFVKWLTAVREITIKEGYLVKLAATYTKDELQDLAEVREHCLRLLKKDELLKMTKLSQRMWEIEALLSGFCESLQGYKSKEKVMDSSDVEFLRKKQDRIFSYINVLPKRIEKLDQIPNDYSGVHGAESLVTSRSAGPPSEHPHNSGEETT